MSATPEFPRPPFPPQAQDLPGSTARMIPEPDHGEQSYKGSGRLKDKVAVITGADSGIGRAVALAYAREGADVLVAYLNEHEDAQETARLVRQAGRRCVLFAGDIADPTVCRRLIGKAVEEFGHIDILVNNAGFENIRPSLDVDEELWDSIVDTNLKGAFFWSQAVAREMARRGNGGSIVNLCSLTSYVGIPTAVAYTSSKSGLLGMTRALSAEWAPEGIRVNAIAPGYFRTNMTEVFYEDDGWRESMLAKIPQKRFGKEEDLAGAVVFLASDASAYVTGHCIPVDGGFLASI